jgi:ketosteroid isomerase-like protein
MNCQPWMLLLILALSFSSCRQPGTKQDPEALKKEIVQMERSFCKDLHTRGAAYAFYTYAAPEAVIKRENDTLIKGREAIKLYYSKPEYLQATANWEPDYTDVSADGTLAYTWGKFSWTGKDTTGKEFNYSGVFHTVWKKQPDGGWKYVWD